ncbi:MAG TPA: hypothetical protein VKB67_08795 [Rhizomicrobium sp.]|nr:hypothetical protein [Rhizomicrobium sp.]
MAGKTKAPRSRQASTFQCDARKHALKALDMLFELAAGADSEAVRVSAIKELLDRGFGKSGALASDPDHPVLTRIERVIVHPKNRDA